MMLRTLCCVLLMLAAFGNAAGQSSPGSTPSPNTSVPQERLVMALRVHGIIDTMIAADRVFRQQTDSVASPEIPWFEVRSGESRILVVASHATSQRRKNRVKGADLGTGAMAMMLNRFALCPAIYTTMRSPADPNGTADGPFRDSLKALILRTKPAMVLDLHASDHRKPYDVDFGTRLDTPSYLGKAALFDKLVQSCRISGMTNLSQNFFPASTRNTITKFVSGMGVPCIQMEINGTYLTPQKDELFAHRSSQLLEALIRFISYVDGKGRTLRNPMKGRDMVIPSPDDDDEP